MSSIQPTSIHPRDDDTHDVDRPHKRAKLEDNKDIIVIDVEDLEEKDEPLQDQLHEKESLLPPSHALLSAPPPVYTEDGSMQKIMETDVGISEYVGHDVPMIKGIIKQRFTDFLVFEVDLDGNVIHVKSLSKPESTIRKKPDAQDNAVPGVESGSVPGSATAAPDEANVPRDVVSSPANVDKQDKTKESGPWPDRFDTVLQAFLAPEVVSRVKDMYLGGPEPPFVSDSGWSSRQSKTTPETEGGEERVIASESSTENPPKTEKAKRGRERGGRGGRDGRGGRGMGRGSREDHRKVVSDPISSKATRTGLHQAIRDLFGGKLETETDTTSPADDAGSRIVIKWSRRDGRGGRGGGRSDRGRGGRSERSSYPPYIHFTLQKTNRDTQDALTHLSRSLHVTVKDLSVAGTKDKRGVTVQRVSLKRGNKTVEDVWRMANGLTNRRSEKDVLTRRGERGVRIADFNYRKASLELGMLKGNAFVITLRNVQVDSLETIDRAMNVIKTKGFINYYGMQRFGTAAIPTHSIGLAFLKSDWHKAVSLILRPRPGEHPDVVAARKAWLVDGDLDKALELMPRRVVAERCILESYKKQGGDTRNAMGALSTIPRNLRLMYIHAYQSYVWNAIVSERIGMHGAEKPVVGDLVFDPATEEKTDLEENGLDEDVDTGVGATTNNDEGTGEDTNGRSSKRSRRPWEPPKVKTLTETDVHKYTIFDVIMPLPGRDVAFPGGKLGERYKEFLVADGLDPDNFERKQKEYSLGGSYRKLMHLPKELSWSILRYTDPDVALAQADEDKLLGFDPPVINQDGKFLALQIQLTLGTAAYATMALREVTKTETSSHFQTGLTQASEDQKYKAQPGAEEGAEGTN